MAASNNNSNKNICCCCGGSNGGGGNGRSTILSSGESEKSVMMMGVPRRPLSIDLNKAYEEEEDGDEGTGQISQPVDQYHQRSAAETSSSEDVNRRKQAVAWTEEEHRAFLTGLSKLGKGNWKGISTEFVKTKTPAQVTSHAQKYFLKLESVAKAPHIKRRSSIFDIAFPPESKDDEELLYDESNLHPPPPPPPHNSWGAGDAAAAPPPTTHLSLGRFTVRPRPMSNIIIPPAAPHTYNNNSFRPPRPTHALPAAAALRGRSATYSPFNLFK